MHNDTHKLTLGNFALILALLCFRPCLTLLTLDVYAHAQAPQLLEIDAAVPDCVRAPGRAFLVTSQSTALGPGRHPAQISEFAFFGNLGVSVIAVHTSVLKLTLATRAPPPAPPV